MVTCKSEKGSLRIFLCESKVFKTVQNQCDRLLELTERNPDFRFCKLFMTREKHMVFNRDKLKITGKRSYYKISQLRSILWLK